MCTNNALVKEKYGFIIKGCTESASYIVINEMLETMNNTLSVRGRFSDHEKDFDYFFDYAIAVDKLEFYAISGNLFIQSYLR